MLEARYCGWNSITEYHQNKDDRITENKNYLLARIFKSSTLGDLDLYDSSAPYANDSQYTNHNAHFSEGWLGTNGIFGDYRLPTYFWKQKHVKQYIKFERRDGQMRINTSSELSSRYNEHDYVTNIGSTAQIIDPLQQKYLVMFNLYLTTNFSNVNQWPKIEKIPTRRNVIYNLGNDSSRYVKRTLNENDRKSISFDLVGSFKSWSLNQEVSFDIKNFIGSNPTQNKTFFKVFMTDGESINEQVVSANFFHKDITQSDITLIKSE